jgi:hypothetical protein
MRGRTGGALRHGGASGRGGSVGATARRGRRLHDRRVATRSRRPHLAVRADRGDRRARRPVAADRPPGDVGIARSRRHGAGGRTAFDLARRPGHVEPVVGVDAMLNRGGCDLAELTMYVAAHRRWRGVEGARRALRSADAGSQSPMETRLRRVGTDYDGEPHAERRRRDLARQELIRDQAGGIAGSRRWTRGRGGEPPYARSAGRS